jgi:hypothetical protein
MLFSGLAAAFRLRLSVVFSMLSTWAKTLAKATRRRG